MLIQIGSLLGLFVLVFVLVKSADLVLDAVRGLGRATKTKTFILSALILSLATSLPELFVGITSALDGSPGLSFGNILGANITNISLVAGLSAVIAGSLGVNGGLVFKEFVLALFAGALPLVLGLDGTLSRVDGLILLAVYATFTASFFKARFYEIAEHHRTQRFTLRFLKHINQVEHRVDRPLGHLFVGVAAMLFSAGLIVELAQKTAGFFGIPLFVVGLVILSIGTTLPEMIVSIRSIRTGQPSVFFGNLLGSIVVNSTLIVGLVSVISPISLGGANKELELGILFLLIACVLWIFVRTKLTLSRWEGAILVVFYFIFIVVGML